MKQTVFLGVDGGSRWHYFHALDGKGETLWRGRSSNDHTGCEEVLEKVRRWQRDSCEVWVGAEGIAGWLSPLDVRLYAAGCRWVNLHPGQFKRFCEALSIQPDKDDKIDAERLARMLAWQVRRGQAQCCDRGEVYFATLQDTFRSFETLTKTKVACELQLAASVREYWPELFSGEVSFARADSPALLRLLASYPTPERVAKAGRAKVARAMYPSEPKSLRRLERAGTLVNEARRVASVAQVSLAKVRLIRTLTMNLIEQIRTLKEVEKQLEEQVREHAFGRWMLAQEGIGVRTAAGFMAEAGDLDRFEREPQLARYAGNGGNRRQSGTSKERHRDGRKYNSRLKRVTLLLAESRSQHHPPSRAYLEARRNKGDDYWVAVKKLARFQIRFLWKGWQEVVNGRLYASE